MAMPAVCFNFDLDSSFVNDENEFMNVLQIIKYKVPTIEKIIPAKNRENAYLTALKIAKNHTARNKILILEDPTITDYLADGSLDESIEIIPSDNAALLCETIACSAVRIAAIIVKYDKASTYYYKKVRELTSAEGAVMIWDNSDKPSLRSSTALNISKKGLPDLICFNLNTAWIGGRSDLMSLISLDPLSL